MNPGELNRPVIITTITTATVLGRSVETRTTATAFFKVTQIDGSRYLKDDEVIDKSVYRFYGWDNSYSNNLILTYNGMTLIPIRPIKKYPGGANLNEIEIIAATKGTLTPTLVTADSTDITADSDIITADTE